MFGSLSKKQLLIPPPKKQKLIGEMPIPYTIFLFIKQYSPMILFDIDV